jgi:hypothetical protein
MTDVTRVRQNKANQVAIVRGCPRKRDNSTRNYFLASYLRNTRNYRTEYITFEVTNFDTFYHAILGRPAMAKFVAVPHYV